MRYIKDRKVDNLTRINDESMTEEDYAEVVPVETESGWDRASGSVVEDNNLGDLTSVNQNKDEWKIFSQKSMQCVAQSTGFLMKAIRNVSKCCETRKRSS